MEEELAQEIYDALGPGYTESMYHRAFEVALRDKGISYETERIVPVVFREKTIGNIRADLIIDSDTIVELKALRRLNEDNATQMKRYMKLLGLKHGVLINFGPEYLQTRRISECEASQAEDV
jgi:GxxExxY protein